MISAMIVHKDSVRNIVARCLALGKTIIAGGPLFTTGHEAFPEIQHFVLGEAEEIMPQVVEDMRHNRLQPIYKAPRWPDLAQTPVPRWDLINLRHYVTMPAQFSRGCPFNCEFCDIIVMNGRVPRTKSPAQLIAELEALRVRGWKEMVFIVDDNFIGDKRRTRALLREMVGVAAAHGAGNGFSHRGLGQPGGRRGVVRVDGGSRFHQGVCRHRNAVGGGAGGMPQAAESRA